MSINLFLDDERDPSDFYTFEDIPFQVVRTVKEFKKVLEKETEVDIISFDHDLGTSKTGYDALCWLEEQVFLGNIIVKEISIHTANPGALMKMFQAAKKITERVFRPSSKY